MSREAGLLLLWGGEMTHGEVLADAIELIYGLIADAAFRCGMEVEQWMEDDELRGPAAKEVLANAKQLGIE